MRTRSYYTLLFTAFFLFVNRFASAQDTLQPAWYILQQSSLANGNAEAWGLDIHNDKVYWAVSQSMAGNQQMDIVLHRYDLNKNLNWKDTVISDLYTQQAYFLTLTDSLAYIGGRTCRTLIGIDSCDALVAAADANTGALQWETSWTRDFGYEEVDGIVPQQNGLLVSGWSMGDTTAMDLFLQHYDHNASLQWSKTWSSPGQRDDHQDGHIVVDDSMVYMAGLYDGSQGLGWNGKSLLVKHDKNSGTLVDSITFGRSDAWTNAENALGMTTDGQYLYLTGYTTPSSNNWDIFVAKYDKNLNQMWYTTWGGNKVESARSLVIDTAGRIFVSGKTESYGTGGFDLVLLELGPAGNVQNYQIWGDTLDDSPFDTRWHKGFVYITGRTNSFHPNEKNEALLMKVKVDSTVNGQTEWGIRPKQLQTFPNPADRQFRLYLPRSVQKGKITLYNLQGRAIRSWSALSGSTFDLDVSRAKPGVYFVRLREKGRLIGVSQVVVR